MLDPILFTSSGLSKSMSKTFHRWRFLHYKSCTKCLRILRYKRYKQGNERVFENTLLAHPTTGGGRELEKEYGRDLETKNINNEGKFCLVLLPLSEKSNELVTATSITPSCSTKSLGSTFSFWQAYFTYIILASSTVSSFNFIFDRPTSIILYLLHQETISFHSAKIPINIFGQTLPKVELMMSTAPVMPKNSWIVTIMKIAQAKTRTYESRRINLMTDE